MERNSFIFYRSFYEALKTLPLDDKAKIYEAIIAYGLDGITPTLEGYLTSLFTLVKPQIEANNKKFENGKAGAEHGKKGGRPPKNNPTKTPLKPLNNPTETPNANANANVNEKEESIRISDFQKIHEHGSKLFPNLATKMGEEIHEWLKGFSVELDIIPTLEKSKGRNIKAWSFFSDAIADLKAKREAAQPKSEAQIMLDWRERNKMRNPAGG